MRVGQCLPGRMGKSMLYRVSDEKTVLQLLETTAASEQLLEVHLESWVARSPSILGEDLLVIARQVTVDGGKDRIDLLALDLQANVVVIELKRDWVGDDADLQAIRYASRVASWDHADLRKLAESYWTSTDQGRGTFTQELDVFCDADYELNTAQRIVLAGRRFEPRAGTMVMWLREHNIDVRVVTLGLFRDEDRVYLQPQVVIPLPTEETVAGKPTPDQADKEWLRDGRAWHLEHQLAANGRAIVEAVVELLAEAVPEADGPHFGQKQYIAWRQGPKNWLGCYTDSSNQAGIFVRGLEHIDSADLAQQLGDGWAPFDATADLADKFALGSSVGLDTKGRMRFIIKAVSDVTGPAGPSLGEILRLGWGSFATGATTAPAW